MRGNHNDKKNVFKRVMGIIQIILLFIIIVGIPLLIFALNPEFKSNFSSVEAFNSFIRDHQDKGIWIYLLCQIAQVVIAVLPGQIIQIAGGYMFGLLLSVILSISGVAIGTSISFYIARIVGKKPLHAIFGDDKFDRYIVMLNTKKAYRILFLLYLIPGLPKDVLPYAAGVSNIRFLSFLIMSIVGRFPAMLCSLLMGTFMMDNNRTGMITVAIVVAIAIIICFIKRKKLDTLMDRYYNRMNDQTFESKK